MIESRINRILIGFTASALVVSVLGSWLLERAVSGGEERTASARSDGRSSALDQATAAPERSRTPPPRPASGPPDPWTDELPGGRDRIFERDTFLVAYYGTAGSGVLGVLGEDDPDRIMSRLRTTGNRFLRRGERLLPVYELIVTVADAKPGKDGDYSHHIAREHVEEYVAAARRNEVLLVLDIQPGRGYFLDAAKHWEWALRDPWVGLALDPEWRMYPRQVPGRVIGSVGAWEVNRVAAWLATLTERGGLPEKLFMVHQFRLDMIRDIDQVRRQPGLAMVQHVDGFGNPGQKLATYRTVARPRQFTMGFKLFYDEDRPRMPPAWVRRMRPEVRFVSFQ
ncbi:MAG: hypothetical protein ACRCYQ_07550 [Nocardioides sp.]